MSNYIIEPGHPIAVPDTDPDVGPSARTLRRLTTESTYLFANLATTLARVDVDGIDSEVERSLQLVGRAVGADRVALCTFEGERLAMTSQWLAKGGWMDASLSVELSKATWLRAELAARRTIIVHNLANLPRSAHYERSVFSARGTEGLVAVPLHGAARCIVVETLEQAHWTGQQVALLESFGDVVAAALERRDYDRSLVDEARQARADSHHHANLFATLAHELRTPLTAIVGYSEMLQAGVAGDLSERQTTYIDDILSSALHLAGLIKDCMELSRIDTGRPSMDITSIDPTDPVRDALRHVAPDAARGRITIVSELPGTGIMVQADHQKLVQLTSNLLVNAVKFTPPGGVVTVRVSVSDETYSIEVHDTGVGIPERDQKKIFQLFAQTETGGGSADRGIGLGLALVQRIVGLHDGTISLHSRKGEGSRFTATLARLPGLRANLRSVSLEAFENL